MSAHDDASHESARTIDEALGAAPALLDSAAGRRQQAEIRARLFDTPIEPEHIGRFEVIRRLGAGAGGVVYLARDARLHREVAIKVMRQHVADAARLRREAMTMARLSHPNIATVFEIGTHEGRVYLVMELVHGVTLRVWQGARSWPEIVGAYLQAGAGLAAAHRAGVVHRDFKPDNVMIDAQQRVRVLDFGLARGDELEPASPGWLELEPTTLATTLTGSGTTLGTPAYMPPEQLRSAAVDARADQFAFCVALFEACFGVRPFAGDTVREIYEAIEAGRVRAAPRDRKVPRGLRQVLVRGLAADPQQRWPDLDALLVAIDRARRRPLRRVAIAGGAIACAVLGVAAMYERDGCVAAIDALDEAWSTARADRLRARVRSERDDAQPWRTRIDELERGADEWRAEALALCRAPASDAALRRACLDDVRTAIANVADGLDAALDRGAVSPDARGLLSTGECLGLRERGMLPDLAAHDQLADTAAIRAAITTTIEAGDRGDYAAAGAAIDPAVARARAIDEPALLAEALLLQAAVAGYRGELAIAEQEIGEAFEVARAAGADRLALRAATDALDVVGHAQRRREDGERWAREGEAFAARLPEQDAARLRFFLNRGLMRVTFGQLDEARADLELVRAGWTARAGPQAVELEAVLGNLAHIEMLTGAHARALELLDEAIAIRESADGRDHPDLVTPLCNRSLVLTALARFDDALADLARARSICDAHDLTVERAWIDDDLAEVRWEQGRFADARAAAERGIAGLVAVHGEDHPHVLGARTRLGRILVAQADDAAAARVLHDVVARAEARADSSEEIAIAQAELVGIDRRLGELDLATRELARALASGQEYPCSAALAIAHASAAEVEVVGAPAGEADTALRDSLRTIVSGLARCDGIIAAEVELALARVLARAGDTGDECRTSARRAIDRWRARGNGWLARAEAAERWLATLPAVP